MLLNTIQLLSKADIGKVDSTEVFDTIEKAKNVDPGVVQTYLKGLVPDVLAFAIQVAVAVLVYIVGVKLIKLARTLLRKWLERRGADVGVKQFLDALIKYACYFILIMIILSRFGIATTSTLAVLGSAGLTIGLALQGSLSNFAGGVLILVLKPFKVGDYIIEDSHKNEGTVHEISIFYTKLATADHKIIVIPNGTLANTSLTNVTQSDKRRLDIVVGVSYESDLQKVKRVLSDLVEQEPERLKDEAFEVVVSELAESSVKMGIRIWVPTDKYWEVRNRMMEEIKTELDKNEIEIPFPRLDVKFK